MTAQLDLFSAAPKPEQRWEDAAAKAAQVPSEARAPKGVINDPHLKRGKCYRLRRGGHVLRVTGIIGIAMERLGPVADDEPAWAYWYSVEHLDTGERYDKAEAALLAVLDSHKAVRPPKVQAAAPKASKAPPTAPVAPVAPAAPGVQPTAPVTPATAPTAPAGAAVPCCVCQRSHQRPGGWSYAQTFTFTGRVHVVCLAAYGPMVEAWWAVHADRADVDTGAVLQLLDAPRAGRGWDVDAPIFRAVGHAWHNAGKLHRMLRATR
jgi:hypothetical protein